MKPVIALVGYPASGKEGVSKLLQARDFSVYSAGDVLRRISQNRGLSIERPQLTDLGNILRAELGSEALVLGTRRRLQEVSKDPSVSGLIVDSLRNPGEVRFLKNEIGALVINVWVPEEIRFQRMLERGKAGDPTTWEGFQALNAIDHGIGQESTGQNIAGCIELADVALNTEGSMRDVELRLDGLLAGRGIIEGQYGSPERY